MSRKRTFTQLIALLMAICIFFALPVQSNAATSDYARIYWVQTDDSRNTQASLREQIQLFSQELQAHSVTSDCLPIVYGAESGAADNDIVLILDSSLNIAEQGYKVVNENNRVTVSASDADGLFYGCRNVIKQLKLGDVSNKTSNPAVLERGLSLDNGRKYYSVDWIKKMIRELSWAEMNTLVLHFTEEMGIGIASEKYPWLAGRDGTLCTQAEVATDNTVLTHDEVREIIAYAKKYHIEIIPSLDSPGHMNYMVKKFNEKCKDKAFTFQYGGKEYTAKAGTNIGNYFKYGDYTTDVVPGSRNTDYSRGIDISNTIAVAFTKSLIAEYAELFREAGCTKFDIGGDELLGWGSAAVSTSTAPRWQQLDHWKTWAQNRAKAEGNDNWASAVAYDGFMYYMNDLKDMLLEMEYSSVRMWNDDVMRKDAGWSKVVKLDTDIDIWYWQDSPQTAETYANAGHDIYNIISDYNYYALTADYFSGNRGSFTKSYADQIYNNWTPYNFDGGGTCNTNVKGSAFAIWSDNPTLRTETQVMEDVLPMLRAHGAKAWDPDANNAKNYSSFTADWNTLGECNVPTKSAPEVTTLIAAAFRTKNVHSGGTAVLRLIVPSSISASNIRLTDSSKNLISFSAVKIPNETVEAGKQALYLKFTVTGLGKQTYTVTAGSEVYTASVNVWRAAQ